MNLDAKKTIGDLITSGRRLYIQCYGDGVEDWCSRIVYPDLTKFPRDMDWEDLPKRFKFRCSACGRSNVKVKLEIEREWKRRLRR